MYTCQCGCKLKKVNQTKFEDISFKVLIVKTVTHYKCPNGCELKTVSKLSKK